MAGQKKGLTQWTDFYLTQRNTRTKVFAASWKGIHAASVAIDGESAKAKTSMSVCRSALSERAAAPKAAFSVSAWTNLLAYYSLIKTTQINKTMNIYNEIKKSVPDLEYAKLNYSYIMSRGEAQEKVESLEKQLGGLAVYYELTGKRLTIYYSPALGKEWEGNIVGKKVRLVRTSVVGEVTSEKPYFISGSRCVRCQFGKDNDAYDITNLESVKQKEVNHDRKTENQSQD